MTVWNDIIVMMASSNLKNKEKSKKEQKIT